MNEKKPELQQKWLLLGTVPNPTLAAGYVVSDFYFSSESVKSRAAIFFIAICVASLLACFAIYRVRGWNKLLPALSLSVGVAALTWLLFVLSFSVTF